MRYLALHCVVHVRLCGLQVAVAGSSLTDEELCALLSTRLHIDASSYLCSTSGRSAQASGARQSRGKAAAPGGGGGGGLKLSSVAAAAVAARAAGQDLPIAPSSVTLENFVRTTSELLELERQSEVEAAQEAVSLLSPETAQVCLGCHTYTYADMRLTGSGELTPLPPVHCHALTAGRCWARGWVGGCQIGQVPLWHLAACAPSRPPLHSCNLLWLPTGRPPLTCRCRRLMAPPH